MLLRNVRDCFRNLQQRNKEENRPESPSALHPPDREIDPQKFASFLLLLATAATAVVAIVVVAVAFFFPWSPLPLSTHTSRSASAFLDRTIRQLLTFVSLGLLGL